VNASVAAGTSSFSVGDLDDLDSGWAQIFGVGLLVVIGGIFSAANARIGALVLPGVALFLFVIGVLDGVVTVGAIGIAFAVAVGINLISADARVRV